MEKEKRILPIDSQVLDAVQKCGFFTYLNFIKNWRPNEVPAPIERGDLGHTILEMYYNLLKKGTSWDEAVKLSAEVGREHYQSLELDLQTAEWIIRSFYDYAQYYKHDGLQVHSVEEAFSFILYEDDELIIVYEGKIDLVGSLPVVGKAVVDHKWRAMRADYSPLDNQFIGYSIYENTNLVYVNEVGLQKSYEPEKKFRRVPIPIGNGVKEQWKKNTIVWAKILDHYIQNNIWPQSHLKVAPVGITQCLKCKFSRICNSENQEEQIRKIESEFHIGDTWSPHKEKIVEGNNEDETST